MVSYLNPVLDPRINYKGLIDDHNGEPDLLEQVENRKFALETYYALSYAGRIVVRKRTQVKQTSSSVSLSGIDPPPSPEKFNFTARYAKQPANDRNELEEYFRQAPELWDGCDPVKWWGTRQAQFPNLCRLARDILTIPGKIIFIRMLKSKLHSWIPTRLCRCCRTNFFWRP